jgi:corrinoid protein of di/trimethylamine methyltransferase
MKKKELIEDLKEAVIQGIPTRAVELAKQIVVENIDPVEAIEDGLKAGIAVVGDGFANGRLFLPDLVLSAETLKAASAILEDQIKLTGVKRSKQGKVILGTVRGDLHDIGKTIVATLLTANGFDVVDLGVNVPAERFIETIRREKPDVVGMSSLLTTTAKELANVIATLKVEGLRDSVKVVVGGGAVTEAYAEKIEADGYGQNAGLGVQMIKRLLDIEWTKAD